MNTITVNVFHDERMVSNWLYHGMLFVPTVHEDWLMAELHRLREGYDGFVHFVDLRNPAAPTPEGSKSAVANRWAQFLMDDTRHSRKTSQLNNFCGLVLGVNLEKLNRDCFGERADRNIFNRFFRTTLLSGLKQFYARDCDIIEVERVYHGTQDVAVDNPLRWHPMWKIEHEADGSIVFQHSSLTLVAADHRREKAWPLRSNIVQLVDILVGGFSQCLDGTSSGRGCTEVGRILQPLVERLTRRPENKNSRYFGKYSVSFFPSHRLSLQDLGTAERHRSSFYYSRALKIIALEQSSFDF